MDLSSPIFIFGFWPCCFLVYCILPKRIRNAFLILSSIFFYAWNEPGFVVYLAVMWIGIYIAGKCISKMQIRGKRIVLCLTVFICIGVLFYYKYLNFFAANVNRIFGRDVLCAVDTELPLGISFITFTFLAYLFDAYYGKIPERTSLANSGLYFFFFPKISMGPITRYGTMSERLQNKAPKLNVEEITDGIQRFAVGLAKKMIFSNTFAMVADRYWGITDFSNLSVAGSWLSSICYSLQIYYDFSGYSDMAIGIAEMFGFHLEENFKYPYAAKSIGDFWRRWHISLSQWFRDYVYIPLGGNRVTLIKQIRNLFIVWLLTGIWHGANWTFIAWGLFYFVLQLFEKRTELPKRISSVWGKSIYRLFTLLCVNFAWVLFRAPDLRHAGHFILCMFGLQNNLLIDAKTAIIFGNIIIVLLIAVLFALPILPWISSKMKSNSAKIIYSIIKNITILILFVVAVSYCINSTYNPFIYQDF